MPLEPGWVVLDPRFEACRASAGAIERLWTGGAWCEGPAWLAAQDRLVWSDIPNNRMLRRDADGAIGLYKQPSDYANGNTVDREGRLVTCQHLTRRVVRTEHDGRITVLADRWRGKRLNSPNDVVVHADGAVWFTDPTYGIRSDYEGRRADSEIGLCGVYRLDLADGRLDCVADDFLQPNGLAFAPDGSALYVADTAGADDPAAPRHIRRCELIDGGTRLGASRVFADCTAGSFDGFRFDGAGRLWAGAGDGVHVYLEDGSLIGKLLLPERAANLCFAGDQRDRLYVCATSSLYACRVPAAAFNVP